MLKRHRIQILNEFSSTERVNLNWIQYLIYGIALIWILVIYGNDQLIFSASVLFVIFIGYFGIRQEGVFTSAISMLPLNTDHAIINPFSTVNTQTQNQENLRESLFEEEVADETIIPLENNDRKKYAKSGLTSEAAKDLHQNLLQLMATENVYLEPELTLTDLANRLNTHPNYVSQVINDLEGTNFYDFINSLRVEEFKRRVAISDIQKYTLLSLAFDCGFNSKSSFNKYFRKITGISPSDYLTLQNNNPKEGM